MKAKLRNRALLLLGALGVAVVASFFTANPAGAAGSSCTWNGATSNNWNTATNWTCTGPDTIPNTGDTAIFPTPAPTRKSPIVNTAVSLTTLRFDGNGYSLSPNGANILTVSGDITDNATSGSNAISANIALSG